MMKRLCLLLCLGLLMVGGCASHRSGASYWPEDFPTGAVTVVAEHLADMLAATYPPGYTALHLAQTGDDQDELGPALETALRSRGFTLAPEEGGQALPVSYLLDRVDEATWYSRLAVSDDVRITRTWSWTESGLVMEAATKTGRVENTDGQE
jgi:hypothetical protein